ncbi:MULTISPECIES: hypothetical protein [Clostridium]|uniref:hypothetical protein n=1 Tax=Clostridium TaxID=1485 RepID=UPI00189B1256|nr:MULTISPECIES: hypothetical protein [Clostridium]MDI9216582.1 hypothetical protein [Clostridium tertium]
MERLDCNDLNKDSDKINGDLFENINKEAREIREKYENDFWSILEEVNKETYEIKEKNEEIIRDIKQTSLQANCRLEMHIESENKVIYVRPCRAQYFLLSSKCYENVNVKYMGANYNEKLSEIHGAIGNYYILNAGILLVPKRRIRPGAIDILPLVAYYGDDYYRFEAIFNYAPYQCWNR